MNKVAVIGVAGNSVFLSVGHFASEGETVEAQSVHFEPGGKGFNQAVAAARYGAGVAFLSATGQDDLPAMRAYLEKEGIKAVLIPKAGQTAFASIVTDMSGKNNVTVYQGVRLTPEDIVSFEAEIAAADILLLTNETSEEANAEAVRSAKKHGTRVILNPAPVRPLSPYVSANVDLFTPNEHEIRCVETRTNVVETLGARGCYLKFAYKVLAPPNVEAVDSTGAGDTFNGVFAAVLAAGMSEEEAARAANETAACQVTRKYAVSAIPTRAETRRFIGKN